MELKKIKEIFNTTFEKKEFLIFSPVSLLSSAFPTNFTPSGGEEHLNKVLSEKNPKKSFYTIQKCFRYQDVLIKDTKFHLPLFDMGVAISVNEMSINEMVESFMFIFNKLNLDKEKLKISLFKGEYIINTRVPMDLSSQKAWENVGIKKNQFTYLDSTENFFMLKSQGYAGIKTEAFYEYEGKFVEIGIIIQLTHKIKDSASKLYLTPFENRVLCLGLGLERLTAINQKIKDIYELREFEIFKDININSKSVQIIRAIISLYKDGATVYGKSNGRVTIFRRVIRNLLKINSNYDLEKLHFGIESINQKSNHILNKKQLNELIKEIHFIKSND